MSSEDRQFMDSVSQSVKLNEGHYSISLPLKEKDVTFPNNRAVAVQRVESLKRKLSKNQEFHQDYTKFMRETFEKGYADEVPIGEICKDANRIWYIPHHGVYHPTKHKLRVVFDCAAVYQGTSLNSQLLQGPDLTSSLIGVLTRFRQESVAFMSDIEGMFCQVRVPAEDTDMLRFLWWPQGDLSQELKEYRMVVHLFGATSSPSCASFALRKCAEDNQAAFSSEATNTVLRNFYVDDCLKSVGSEKQAVALSQELQCLCAAGGFRLTKWISNSRAVLASVHEDDRAKEFKELDLEKDCLPIERALGVQWCVESDMLKFRVSIQNKPLTRRGLLSMVSTIYDPLGFLAPLILPVKQILQELCRTKHAWDDSMPEALALQWHQWVTSLNHLASFEVNRCVKPSNFDLLMRNSVTAAEIMSCQRCGRSIGLQDPTQPSDMFCHNVLPADVSVGKEKVKSWQTFPVTDLYLMSHHLQASAWTISVLLKSRGRTMIKRYGAVFTCLTVRAVHIEVASSLDTDSCIHALRRFIARRGQVRLMRSDNGTNFVGTERELREAVQALENAKIQDILQSKGITWMFNPPAASHFGGVWERQIRTIRKVLYSIVKQETIDDEGLHTLMCDVEAIINSRPITRVSNDPNDLEALTPNHLLLMKAITPLPPGIFDRNDVYSRRRWRQIQYLADLFWRRWTKEYLPDLQEKQKWSHPERNISENDIVLIVDESAPRNSWVMGRVIQTIKDSRGHVRQAKVKSSTTVLLRPVTKLCLLLESDM
ncbi:hypothetical protein N1851_017050 [Merluccius polli]|uniref:Integrase catalytic domain-containing protein n=1 Tax=Merluccius polli TaxID=89951 RepID=A0AA47MQA1_MERPO|nr:hypothetical protein N1851_017050 [Merluccius polli]